MILQVTGIYLSLEEENYLALNFLSSLYLVPSNYSCFFGEEEKQLQFMESPPLLEPMVNLGQVPQNTLIQHVVLNQRIFLEA